MNYSVLSSELDTDPLARGYSGMSDSEAAADLNSTYRTRNRDTVAGSEIFNVTDDGEFAAMTAEEQDQWLQLCQIDTIDISSGIAKALEVGLFGAGTNTRANLQAVKLESISRAVELGFGFVKVGHVAKARSV